MKKKMSILLLTVAVIAGVLSGCGKTGAPADDKVFSEMETTDFTGNAVDSSVFAENKLTLVNVWNVGCTPCIQEMPVLDRLNEEYSEKGVSIKGLVYEFQAGLSEASRTEAENIIEKSETKYQQLLVSEKMAESEAIKSIQAFPTTFFVDSKGMIIDKVEGSNDYDGWKAQIDNALKKVE